MASSSSAPNGGNANKATTTVKRSAAAAALGPADPAPSVKRRRLTLAPPLPPPPSVQTASSRRAAPPSPSAAKTATAPRARATWGTRTPRATTSSSMKGAWLAASRSPTRSAGMRLLFRGVGTPGPTSSVKTAASRASRSAKKTASPAVRSTLTAAAATSKHQREAKSRLLRNAIKKEATQGRDASTTSASSQLQEASMFDSAIRNERNFSEICESAVVSNPLPTVDPFLGVYKDAVTWKDIAKSSVGLSARYWDAGGDPIVHHELSVPVPHSSSQLGGSPNTAEVAVKLCSVMRSWFLDFVDDALDVDDEWKRRDKKKTVESLNKINGWLESQIVEEEETRNKIKWLKRRVRDGLRRSQDYWR